MDTEPTTTADEVAQHGDRQSGWARVQADTWGDWAWQLNALRVAMPVSPMPPTVMNDFGEIRFIHIGASHIDRDELARLLDRVAADAMGVSLALRHGAHAVEVDTARVVNEIQAAEGEADA